MKRATGGCEGCWWGPIASLLTWGHTPLRNPAALQLKLWIFTDGNVNEISRSTTSTQTFWSWSRLNTGRPAAWRVLPCCCVSVSPHTQVLCCSLCSLDHFRKMEAGLHFTANPNDILMAASHAPLSPFLTLFALSLPPRWTCPSAHIVRVTHQ